MDLAEGERIEDLGNGFLILQNDAYFSFGTDAILLADFADVFAGERVVELGTGCGIIPLLLCAKTKDLHITAIEIQPELARMAQKSVALNGMEQSICVVCGDLKDTCAVAGLGVDAVVVNPPYEKAGAGKQNASPQVNIAKREMLCTLDDIVCAAARVLRTGGRLYMIYRTERFAELMECMRRHRVEPKCIRMVCQQQDKAPNFALVEGRRGGAAGVKFLPSLVLYAPDGSYTSEAKKIYHIAEEG